jgi:hypothetical protein
MIIIFYGLLSRIKTIIPVHPAHTCSLGAYRNTGILEVVGKCPDARRAKS